MTLDDIPADQPFTMDAIFQRLFRAAGCEPECHVCRKDIEPGARFSLVSVPFPDDLEFDPDDDDPFTDEMVCERDGCGRAGLEGQRQEAKDRRAAVIKERADWEAAHPRQGSSGARYGGGYSRPSRRMHRG